MERLIKEKYQSKGSLLKELAGGFLGHPHNGRRTTAKA